MKIEPGRFSFGLGTKPLFLGKQQRTEGRNIADYFRKIAGMRKQASSILKS